MLEKLKINKDMIAIGIAILLAIILYGKYIATPFGDYDTWFERIAYGGHELKELPGPLQNLKVPTSLSEYSEYRERVVGRLFGSVLPTYAMVKIFGDRVLGWRIVLYLVMFATFWLLYSILIKLQVSYWHRLFCLLFFVILLNRYFFKPISIIIGLSHLFFLMALRLELSNSGLKDFRLRYSILGAFFVFLALFIRELSATSVPALLAVLLFWHHETDTISIKFKWDWRRLAPYAFFAALYAGLYLRMSLRKFDYAYSNMISWQIDLAYLKRAFLLLIKWIGLDASLYLGFFIALLVGSMFLLTLLKARYLPQRISTFTLFFGLLLLAPTVVLVPFMKHGTGSFTLQYLACMIIISFFIAYMEKADLGRSFKKACHFILCFVFASLWIVYALEARQKAENYCVDAEVTAEAVKVIAGQVPENGVVDLAGFPLTSAYSFVSDMFLSGRKDNIRYRLHAAANEENDEKYMNYLRSGFSGAEPSGGRNDLLVKKVLLTDDPAMGPHAEHDRIQILRQPIKKYSLGYRLVDSKNNDGKRHSYNAIETFLSKFIFAVRPQTLESQLVSGIEYRIERPRNNEVLLP
jgi:hypothetical protein